MPPVEDLKVFNESPYDPQSSIALKRSHCTLGEYLRSFASKEQLNWDDYIPFAMFASKFKKHASIGYQPDELWKRSQYSFNVVKTSRTSIKLR